MDRIITLTTDFGLKDAYAGAVKGVILSINPEARVVDISHLVPPGNILEGAMILRDASRFFPPGAIHLAVVDPGVGGRRKPILIETKNYLFVGPDNGLMKLAAKEDGIRRITLLAAERYFRKTVSATFHGRDIFAPVAAHLSLGVRPSSFGNALAGCVDIGMPPVAVKGGVITGEVVYADSFGNLVTNITGDSIARNEKAVVGIGGRAITGIKKTYSSAARGEVIALIGSADYLEIAVVEGSAARLLKAKAGVRVTVR